MKPNMELNSMMFFDAALEEQRSNLLSDMAAAVSECREAADQAAQLSEDGEAGLLRLTEIWCAMNGVPVIVIFEGGQSELLASVVAQIYAYLIQHPSRGPQGLALYVELRYMMASLMMGEWFDYIAIFHLNLGVLGAAVATGISQLVTCILYLIHFFSNKCTFHLRKFPLDLRLYALIIPIGLADGVTELCTGLMIFLFNHTVLRCIGTDGVVTYTVIAYVNTIVINLMVGISQGSQPLVSYHYGKSDYKSCRTLLRYGLTTVCILSPLILIVLLIFAPQIVHAYLSHATQSLVEYSIVAFRHYSISYLLVGFNVVIGGFMTALKQPVPALSISIGRGFVLQSIVLLALAITFGGDTLWYTPIFSEALCLCLSIAFLRHCSQKFLSSHHPAADQI